MNARIQAGNATQAIHARLQSIRATTAQSAAADIAYRYPAASSG